MEEYVNAVNITFQCDVEATGLGLDFKLRAREVEYCDDLHISVEKTY